MVFCGNATLIGTRSAVKNDLNRTQVNDLIIAMIIFVVLVCIVVLVKLIWGV